MADQHPTDTIWSRTCFGRLISHLVLISETDSLDDHDNDDDDSADDDDEDRDNYDALATLSLWTRPILLITSAGCRRLCTGQRHPYYAVMLKLLKLLREKKPFKNMFQSPFARVAQTDTHEKERNLSRSK